MTTNLVMEMRQTQTLNAELEIHWNKKLTKPLALAPRDMQGQGLSELDYESYSQEFNDFCSNYVKTELKNMRTSLNPGFRNVISVLGVGIGRGLGFIPYANQLGMEVELLDVSDEALKYADKALRRLRAWSANSVHKIEILGNEGEISYDAKVIVMSQFLQVLQPPLMQAVMRNVGRHILLGNCRVIIVHPFNNPDAVWGDTTPYTLRELLEPVREVLGYYPKLVRHDRTRYFGRHIYRALTFTDQ